MLKTTSDIEHEGKITKIKFPDMVGVLVLERKERMPLAKWDGETVPVSIEDDVLKVFLPEVTVRIFEANSGGHLCVDYE